MSEGIRLFIISRIYLQSSDMLMYMLIVYDFMSFEGLNNSCKNQEVDNSVWIDLIINHFMFERTRKMNKAEENIITVNTWIFVTLCRYTIKDFISVWNRWLNINYILVSRIRYFYVWRIACKDSNFPVEMKIFDKIILCNVITT